MRLKRKCGLNANQANAAANDENRKIQKNQKKEVGKRYEILFTGFVFVITNWFSLSIFVICLLFDSVLFLFVYLFINYWLLVPVNLYV